MFNRKFAITKGSCLVTIYHTWMHHMYGVLNMHVYSLKFVYINSCNSLIFSKYQNPPMLFSKSIPPLHVTCDHACTTRGPQRVLRYTDLHGNWAKRNTGVVITGWLVDLVVSTHLKICSSNCIISPGIRSKNTNI